MTTTAARLVGEKIITEPVKEPVTLHDLKSHLRIDSSDEDTLIASLGRAARRYCEGYTSRSFINTVADFTFDGFPSGSCPIVIHRAPLVSIASITYLDSAGDSQTWASSSYRVDLNSEPGRVEVAFGEAYPTTRGVVGEVTVRAIVGYGTDPSNVPDDIVAAIKLMASHLFENRGGVEADVSFSELPLGVRSLLDAHVVEWAV